MNILFGSIIALYSLLCFFLIFIILMQKGKSSMGFGHMGGTSQLLFGGSGGQDILQKITWFLGMVFIFGSLGLALVKSRQSKESRYVPSATVLTTPAPTTAAKPPVVPVP